MNTKFPSPYIDTENANSSLTGKTKQDLHYKFIETTYGLSWPIVWWSRGWTRQDLCIFTTLISQQNRNTWRNSIELYFKQHHRLSTQLGKRFAVLMALRAIHCITEWIMQNLHMMYYGVRTFLKNCHDTCKTKALLTRSSAAIMFTKKYHSLAPWQVSLVLITEHIRATMLLASRMVKSRAFFGE